MTRPTRSAVGGIGAAVLAATLSCVHDGPTFDGAGGAAGAGSAGFGAIGGAVGSAGASGASGASSGGFGGSGGASGTGGKAGKGGASGASGASGGGGLAGANACDGPMVSCTGCELCSQSPTGTCAAMTAACAKNPECVALQDCQNMCVDSMCATMCDQVHPMGVAAYTAFNSCGLMACTQSCSTKLVCSGIPSGVTGACFASEPCNPITNKGCDAMIGEVCDFNGMVFKCFGPPPANDIPLCGACDVDACKTGMFCLPTTVSGNAPKCVAYCCTDADCGPMGTCAKFAFPEGGGCLRKLGNRIGPDIEVTRLIRDRDKIFGAAVDRRVESLGVTQFRTAPRSSWQNGFAERLVGTFRRELV